MGVFYSLGGLELKYSKKATFTQPLDTALNETSIPEKEVLQSTCFLNTLV